jgi:cytidylate kinase
MVRVITISREYGSGGGTIGRLLATRLNWKLLDASLIEEIAKAARVDPALVERYDEVTDPWFRRVVKALWRGGYEGAATAQIEDDAVDADTIAGEWHRVILQSASIGQCVAVGRGGQCLLQDREDTFHVSVYAPLNERMERIRQRVPPGADLAALARETDRKRAAYIQRHFGQDWTNRHLYNLMICSSMGLETACDTILCAAGLVKVGLRSESILST